MTVHLQQLKGMQSSKQVMCKGYYLSIEGVRKGYLFREKWYIKGKGVGPRGGASPYKNLLTPPGINPVSRQIRKTRFCGPMLQYPMKFIVK